MPISKENYNEIMQDKNGVRVKSESQNKEYGQDSQFNRGICLGLGLTHIFNELENSKQNSSNPFEHKNNRTPFDIQACQEASDKSLKSTFDCLEKHYPLDTTYDVSTTTLKENQIKNHEVEVELKNITGKAETDSKTHGVLISTYFKDRNDNDDVIDQKQSGHALTFTARKKSNNKLYCTGMDPNIFFASGEGRKACDEIVRKLSDTVEKFYEADIVHVIDVEQEQQPKKKGWFF